MSGDIFYFHSFGVCHWHLWVETRDAAQILQCTNSPAIKDYLAPNIHSAEVAKL